MRYSLIIFLFLVNLNLLGQKVKLIDQADPTLSYWHKNKGIRNVKGFTFLEDAIDRNNLKYVATFKIGLYKPVYLDGCEAMYDLLSERANNLGANCFAFKDSSFVDSQKIASFTVIVFYASDSILILNQSMKPNNFVCVLADNQSPKRVISFDFNNRRIKLSQGQYFKYFPKPREKFCISKNYSKLGDQKCLVWTENQHAVYLKIKGFDVGPGLSFSGGEIDYENEELGELLIKRMLNMPISFDENSK
jgi:hypothetical protein